MADNHRTRYRKEQRDEWMARTRREPLDSPLDSGLVDESLRHDRYEAAMGRLARTLAAEQQEGNADGDEEDWR